MGISFCKQEYKFISNFKALIRIIQFHPWLARLFPKIKIFFKNVIDIIFSNGVSCLRCESDVRNWEQINEPLGIDLFSFLMAFFVARAISRLNERAAKNQRKGGILLWQKVP